MQGQYAGRRAEYSASVQQIPQWLSAARIHFKLSETPESWTNARCDSAWADTATTEAAATNDAASSAINGSYVNIAYEGARTHDRVLVLSQSSSQLHCLVILHEERT